MYKTVWKEKYMWKIRIRRHDANVADKFFEKTWMLLLNVAWMGMIALKCILKHQLQIMNNKRFQNYSSHKQTLPQIFRRNTTFVHKFSMLPVKSVL